MALFNRKKKTEEVIPPSMEERIDQLAREISLATGQQITFYPSNIVLGREYKHKRSEASGHAIAVSFFENACERVTLEWFEKNTLTGKKMHSESFDAVDLVDVETGVQAQSEKTGGPERLATGWNDPPVPERRTDVRFS